MCSEIEKKVVRSNPSGRVRPDEQEEYARYSHKHNSSPRAQSPCLAVAVLVRSQASFSKSLVEVSNIPPSEHSSFNSAAALRFFAAICAPRRSNGEHQVTMKARIMCSNPKTRLKSIKSSRVFGHPLFCDGLFPVISSARKVPARASHRILKLVETW